ncbi:MAG: pancreas/duodenum homeobox protein 1 [Desulfoarculaceae bacterium]|nr:pancreas/duodenum homeobox protein 1 [Desulfoarculaceae bacterium]
MDTKTIDALFTPDTLQQLFPRERSDEFFEALFGDAGEGAYDIELAYHNTDDKSMNLELRLHERPGCCLVCNLTQGLPQVFTRHPVINVAGVVEAVEGLLAGQARCREWSLGRTEQRRKELHVIPLTIKLDR